jgi:hypothetical protein
MPLPKKNMGVQQILLHPDKETEALLQYLCEQSGKVYNSGVYFARQIFFKTGKLLTGKYDLDFEPSVAKTQTAQSLPSTPMQQTLISVTESFKSFKEFRSMHFKGNLHFQPKAPAYLKGSKLFKVAYPNSGGQKPKLIEGMLRFSLGLTVRNAVKVWTIANQLGRRSLTPESVSYLRGTWYELTKQSHGGKRSASCQNGSLTDMRSARGSKLSK